MTSKKISVLVTGVGGLDLGESIVMALGLAEGNKYKIIGANMNPFSASLFRVDKGFLVPSATSKHYIQKLLDICLSEKVEVLIPGSEMELEKIAENREVFESHNIIPLIGETDIIKTCLDKWELYRFLSKKGILCPKTVLPENKDVAIEDLGFPLLIKARRSCGSKNIFLAQDLDDLNFFISYLKKYGIEPIIQEYVGAKEQEFTISVLVSKKGDIIGSFAMHRELTGISLKSSIKKNSIEYALSTGISQGLIDDFPEIRTTAEDVVQKMGGRGPMNVQGRLTSKGFSIFEINPRFSGTTSIRAYAGFNEPDLLIRNFLFDEQIKTTNYTKKLVAMRGINNIFVDLKTFNSFKQLKMTKE